MREKAFCFILLLLITSGLVAQFQAPEILGVRSYFYDPEQCADVRLFWSEITEPDFDHYEVYWDNEFQGEVTGFDNCLFLYLDFTVNVYHSAGVKAVYNSGESEINTINFYLSEPLYAYPENLNIINDFSNLTMLFQWDEPETSGDNPPLPVNYDVYLNNEYIDSTSNLEYTFENMTYGESYNAGITVNYDDGFSSLMFRNLIHKEIYFAELNPPDQIVINSEDGIVSWQNPGQGDIIGGSMMNMVAPIFWSYMWQNPPAEEYPVNLGDGTNNVDIQWSIASWVHNQLKDKESIWVDYATFVLPTLYAATDASYIDQMNDVSSLNYGEDSVYLYDKDTSEDGFGDFVVLQNSDSGYYGVFQLVDVFNYIDDFMMFGPALEFHANWWFQTNGGADFSEAPRYFPLYYNIYLDNCLVDSVNYEMVINDNGTVVCIDSTFTPTNQFAYQFENLIVGQEYTVGIEAVYHVGNAPIAYYDFIYGNAGAENQLVNMTRLCDNYPNPFNPETTISFATTNSHESTRIEVYNLKGQKVKMLVNEILPTGQHEVVWNGTDDHGKSVSSGIYFYQMKSGNYQKTRKMILLK
ncbi:MAG TPA: T9SS type A sorting domain-containing protein [Candidatus Cloacimonadota bacterium]|nr:T9SS type A sorting domain-containing protein [Candidatus Cloacimonadota bacterium]